MKTNQTEQELLVAAGFSYEYPGYWQRGDITLADKVSDNRLPWEVQCGDISRSTSCVTAAIAFADRLEVTRYWKRYGFQITGTGGGCEALEVHWGDGDEYRYIWVTEANDPSLPESLHSQVCVGWYDAYGNCLGYFIAEDSAGAIQGIFSHARPTLDH